ncbi:MAG: Zn-dependent hydrolase [Bacteroidetes bacterium HGW-Bacteroidetes-17]|jgi:hypothetical protein|nr:MAG: Zn-dependent hydrolase [Bacteroidetes bacterium HGW-Bacteroidetes-17]
MKSKLFILFFMSIILIVSGCSSSKNDKNESVTIIPPDIALTPTSVKGVDDRLQIYAPFELKSDVSHLTDNEKEILPLLFQVADIMEEIYWEQTIGNREDFLDRIKDPGSALFSIINYGPWDRLNGNQSFISEIGDKPAGANFYPVDMTKEEFDAFADLNKTSQYTLIRRDKNGALKSVWYHEAFKDNIDKAVSLLKKAANLAEDPGFKKYLTLRAEALATDNYQASDFAWMDMQNSNIDFVVGPIENYEDALYGYKAAHESFILIKDIEWSKKLAKFGAMLPDLQTKLPVEPEYKKEVPGSNADIFAYDVVYYAGDCNAGSKTIAINLPNDEEVHLKMGSRKLQLKNAMRAKFEQIVVPISKMLIDESQQKYVKFDAFFENTMFHEVGHAMGIKNTLNGTQTVREALKEKYSSMEEAKADIMGLYLVTQLYEMGELTQGEVMDNYVTFFAGIFRSSRFGAASAHGKANMMRFNYFADKGVFTRSEEGIYTIHFEEMKKAMIGSLQDILTIQGNGDYEAASKLIEEKGIVMPALQADLDRLGNANIPVDIVFSQGLSRLGL